MNKIEVNEVYKSLYTSDKVFNLLTGGRGSGKSFFVHDWVIRRLLQKGHGVLFLRYTMTSAEKSIIPEFENSLERINAANKFKKSGSMFTCENGSFIIFSGIKTNSGDQTANLKSIPGLTTLVIEEGEDFNDEDKFDDILLSVRESSHPLKVVWVMNPTNNSHFIYINHIEKTNKFVNIDGVDVQISTDESINHIHTTYLNNKKNLPTDYLEKLLEIKENNFNKYAHKVIGLSLIHI